MSVLVTYLEMLEPPSGAPRPAPPGTLVMEAERPTVGFYRYLYNAVGAPWRWYERNRLSDADLAAIVQDPAVAVHVLYHHGTPAGYAEFDRRRPPDVQLAYFGLIPEFIGQGLGGFFLDWAVRAAWQYQPARVWVHTCTLDHPRALHLYERAGFVGYREEEAPDPPDPD